MEQNDSHLKLKRILLIEDDKELQDLIKEALELEGFKVFTANNGREGLNLLATNPAPCLILLDLIMPVMNGWEFMEELNNDLLLSTIPVVIVSGLENKSENDKSYAFIPKPIDLEKLLIIVHKYCR